MSGPGGQATFPSADPPNLIRAQQKVACFAVRQSALLPAPCWPPPPLASPPLPLAAAATATPLSPCQPLSPLTQDEVYLQHLTGACHDAVRRVLGPHAALRWASETRLAAELLYLGLTTGAGRQTLGEEYCDILQVAGAGSAPPGAARRGLLVLLQASGPYLADRLAVPPDDGGDAAFAAWREAQQAAAAQQQQAAQGQQDGQQQQQAAQLLHRLAAALQQLRCEVQRAAQPLARHVPAAAAALRDHGATLLRLHLALFYLYGAYYQPSKRAAGEGAAELGTSRGKWVDCSASAHSCCSRPAWWVPACCRRALPVPGPCV